MKESGIMSIDLLILIKLSLVLLLVFGWGFNELLQLRRYKKNKPAAKKEK